MLNVNVECGCGMRVWNAGPVCGCPLITAHLTARLTARLTSGPVPIKHSNGVWRRQTPLDARCVCVTVAVRVRVRVWNAGVECTATATATATRHAHTHTHTHTARLTAFGGAAVRLAVCSMGTRILYKSIYCNISAISRPILELFGLK